MNTFLERDGMVRIVARQVFNLWFFSDVEFRGFVV